MHEGHRCEIPAYGDLTTMAGVEGGLDGSGGASVGAHGTGVPVDGRFLSICLLIQGRARATAITVNASPMVITAMR